MTTTELVVTLPVDELQPGDTVRLVGTCTIVSVERALADRRLVRVKATIGEREIAVWLWKSSRVEVLSDITGRGHLVTVMHPRLSGADQ